MGQVPNLGSEPVWSEVTAVYGGRFDPPHLGHREAVRGLFSNPGVKRVVILPSGSPPHKPAEASTEDRVAMTQLNFSFPSSEFFHQNVEIDLREVSPAEKQAGNAPEKSKNRPNYSFYTLQEMGKAEPNLAFVVGTDQAFQLKSWHRFPEVLRLSHWIILDRQPSQAVEMIQFLAEWEKKGWVFRVGHRNLWEIADAEKGRRFIALVPTLAPAVSSTQIREITSKTGRPPQAELLPDVIKYLKTKQLYGILQE